MRPLYLFDLALLGGAIAMPASDTSSMTFYTGSPSRTSKTSTSTKPPSLHSTSTASTPIMYWPKPGTDTWDIKTSAATSHHIIPPSHAVTRTSTVVSVTKVSSRPLSPVHYCTTITAGPHTTKVRCSMPVFSVETSTSEAPPEYSSNSTITSTMETFPTWKPLPSTCRYVMVGDNTRIICATDGVLFGRTSTASSDATSIIHSLHSFIPPVKTLSDFTTTTTTTTAHSTSTEISTTPLDSETVDLYGFELVINATLTMPKDEDLPVDEDMPTLKTSNISTFGGLIPLSKATPSDLATSISTSTSTSTITIHGHTPRVIPLSRTSKVEPTHKSSPGHGPNLEVRAVSTGTVTVVVPSKTSVVEPSEMKTMTKVVTVNPSTTTSAPEPSDPNGEDGNDNDHDDGDDKKEDDNDDKKDDDDDDKDEDEDGDDDKPDPPKPEASVVHGSHYHFFKKYDTFVIYGKNFNNLSLSPKCPVDGKSSCKHKFKGKGLKKALQNNLEEEVKRWVYTDDKNCGGNSFCPDEEWDFVVVARTHDWNWNSVDSAVEAAGGPKVGADLTHSDVSQLAGCPDPSRGSRYWDKLMIYLYGGNEELESHTSS